MPTGVALAQPEIAQDEQHNDHGTDEPDDAIHECFLPGWRFQDDDRRDERQE